MTGTVSGEVVLRIEGRGLPGLHWCDHRRVHVGTQRGREPVDLVPGDAAQAVFTVPVRPVTAPDGTPDFRGPHVQGRRGGRFVYLTWGDVGDDGQFAMFRRAKLWLADIPAEQLREAATSGAVLRARLGLTGPDGAPVCASVRPPAVLWEVVREAVETGGDGRKQPLRPGTGPEH